MKRLLFLAFAGAFAAVASSIPELADDLYLEFSRTGNRAGYEKPYFERVKRLERLRDAEKTARDGSRIPEIVALVEAICAERTWVAPAHDEELAAFNGANKIDLFAAERCLALAETFDALKDELPDAVKRLILDECRRRVLEPYLFLAANFRDEAKRATVEPNRRWFDGSWNWNSVCHSCTVRAALMLENDPERRERFIAAACYAAPFALAGYLDDGYCVEGVGYWNFGFGHQVLLDLAIRQATDGKVDLFADPKNRRVAGYALGIQMEKGRAPVFSDSEGAPDEKLMEILSTVYPGFDPAAPLAPYSFFPEAQTAVMRAGGVSLAVVGGHNDYPHNHNDLGSYVVMMNGAEMGGDPGKENYTARTFSPLRYESRIINSYGHPVPVVDLHLQGTGRIFESKILSATFSPAEDRIAYDLAKAYPSTALKSLVRSFAFNRAAGAITITDEVAFAKPANFEVPFVTYCEYEKTGPGMVFRIAHPAGKGAMKLSVEASAPLAFREETLENPGRPPVRRLAFSLATLAAGATIKMTLVPVANAAP